MSTNCWPEPKSRGGERPLWSEHLLQGRTDSTYCALCDECWLAESSRPHVLVLLGWEQKWLLEKNGYLLQLSCGGLGECMCLVVREGFQRWWVRDGPSRQRRPASSPVWRPHGKDHVFMSNFAHDYIHLYLLAPDLGKQFIWDWISKRPYKLSPSYNQEDWGAKKSEKPSDIVG